MTDNNHPITPPSALAGQWQDDYYTPPFYLAKKWQLDYYKAKIKDGSLISYVATRASHWGADQQLQACRLWVSQFDYEGYSYGDRIVAACRGRTVPLSLKEQALAELDLLKGDANAHGLGFDAPAIRRALESLPS